MKKPSALIACLAVLAAALACDAGAAAPTVTLVPSPIPPTVLPTQAPPTATQPTAIPTAAQPTNPPTFAPPTDQPTQGQPTFPTPTPIVGQAQPTSAGVTQVKVYLVAIGDNGKSGPMIGCQDSLVAVDRDIPQTQGALQAALKELFSIKDKFYGQSGLYNALSASSLDVVKVVIDSNGLATINLSGTLSLAGECDNPRVQGQIEYTARQFSTVKDVAIFLNDKALKDVLSLK